MGQRRLVPWVVGIVLVATVALAASAFARVSGAATISVPGLVGREREVATELAKRDGLSVVFESQSSPDPEGVVIDQSPDPGEWTSARQVRAIVSSGPAPVTVPAIFKTQWSSAKNQLDAIGFSYKVTQQYNSKLPAGTVIDVKPPGGQQVAPDATLTIGVSKGPAPVTVPDVTRATYPDAAGALAASSFKVTRGLPVFSNDIPRGQVAYTVPRAGTSAKFGSTVQIKMSAGPIMVTVPDLIGLTFEEAKANVDEVATGLALSVNGSIRGDEVVVDQTPGPRASVPLETTTVELTFGRPGL
jgi:serine/threonine-protein kinase